VIIPSFYQSLKHLWSCSLLLICWKKFRNDKDWLDGIRSNTQPMCNIHRGFEEAMTAHMGTIAYRENRKTFWDKEKQAIV
jgi:hypothetical protein